MHVNQVHVFPKNHAADHDFSVRPDLDIVAPISNAAFGGVAVYRYDHQSVSTKSGVRSAIRIKASDSKVRIKSRGGSSSAKISWCAAGTAQNDFSVGLKVQAGGSHADQRFAIVVCAKGCIQSARWQYAIAKPSRRQNRIAQGIDRNIGCPAARDGEFAGTVKTGIQLTRGG